MSKRRAHPERDILIKKLRAMAVRMKHKKTIKICDLALKDDRDAIEACYDIFARVLLVPKS